MKLLKKIFFLSTLACIGILAKVMPEGPTNHAQPLQLFTILNTTKKPLKIVLTATYSQDEHSPESLITRSISELAHPQDLVGIDGTWQESKTSTKYKKPYIFQGISRIRIYEINKEGMPGKLCLDVEKPTSTKYKIVRTKGILKNSYALEAR